MNAAATAALPGDELFQPWPRREPAPPCKRMPLDEYSAARGAEAVPDATPVDDAAAQELVRATLAGDDHAYTALVRLFKARVLRLVARFARNAGDLDEIAQDVFVDAHRSLRRYRGDAPFEHWLCRIATRRCHDYLRRLYRRRRWSSLDALQETGFDPTAESTAPDARLELLQLALRRLHPDHQTILTLIELQECSVREAAALTGWSEANVKVRAHRARHALRAAFEKLSGRGQ